MTYETGVQVQEPFVPPARPSRRSELLYWWHRLRGHNVYRQKAWHWPGASSPSPRWYPAVTGYACNTCDAEWMPQ